MQNYVMVGAGGTGTHLINPLATYLSSYHKTDEWSLHVIDGDVVEEKNLERQLFDPGTVTQNKAAAVVQGFPKEHVFAHAEYLGETNMEKHIRDGDIVFICVDNFTVRKRIEDHVMKLANVVVINGGNEKTDGSVQLMVREKNEPITPRIGYLHPEVKIAKGVDRAEMTCIQAAALPGGEQTLIVNMQSATWMLTALWRFHNKAHILAAKAEPGKATWTELQFDVITGQVDHIDQRLTSTWRK